MKIIKDPVKGVKWHHVITENTFDEETSLQISQAFNNWSNKKNIDFALPNNVRHTDLKDGYWNDIITGYSGLIFFPDTSRLRKLVCEIFDNTKDSSDYNEYAKDYLVVLELMIMKPKSQYHYHVDAERKQLTGVCYWDQGENGTIIRSGKNEFEIKYKTNNALWFANKKENLWMQDRVKKENEYLPWHAFENTTDKPRYTVNINFTPQKEIDAFLTSKRKQFKYWLNNKEPLWLPTLRPIK